jgi:glycosyltransferase involved in cell wall biosynthesis
VDDGSVVLVSHRVNDPHPTGIGRYYAELVPALARVAAVALELAVPHEPGEARPAWLPADVGLHRLRGPRRALLGAWTALRAPSIDRLVGASPAVVHALHAFAPVPTRAPLVYTVHDVAPRRMPEWYSRTERRLFDAAWRHMADHAAAVVAVSSTIADEIVALGIERSRVVPILSGTPTVGPDPSPSDIDAVLHSAGLERGRYVLAVGEVNGRKDLATVVRALARVPDLVLAVAGADGRGADLLTAAVAAERMESRVRRLGFVADRDVRALARGALALVHPSVYEGFGFVPLEAMALGVAAIVGDGGAVPEVVGDGAVVVPVGDPDRWAEAITAVRDDPEHRAAVVARGAARARALSWDDTAAAVAAVHRRLR